MIEWAGILCLSLAAWKASPGRITFECPATRADVLLAKLSPLVGEKLLTSPTTKNTFLLASLREADPSELLEQIAKAANAEWVQEKEGRRLIRSSKLLRAQESEHFRHKAEAIRQSQGALAARLAEWGAFTAAKAKDLQDFVRERASGNRGAEPTITWEAATAKAQQTPAGRLVLRIASTLDAMAFAKLEDFGRICFDSSAGTSQSILPKSATAAFAQYLTDREMYLRGLPEIDLNQAHGMDDSMKAALRSQSLRNPRPARLHFEINHLEDRGLYECHLFVANSEGQILDESRAWLDSSPTSRPVLATPSAGASDGTEAKWSGAVTAFVESLARRRSEPGFDSFLALPEIVQRIFLDPEDHDFAELAASDVFLALARKDGRSWVVSSNYAFSSFSLVRLARAPLNLTAAEAVSRDPVFQLNRQESSNWVSIRPADPWLEARFVHDRSAVETFLREARQQGRASLADLAAVDSTAPALFYSTPLFFRLSSVLPLLSSQFGSYSPLILKLFGTLNPLERDGLIHEGPKPISQFSPAVRDLWRRLVFTNSMQLVFRSAGPESVSDGEAFVPNLRNRMCQRFPGGLPPNALFGIRRKPVIEIHSEGRAANGTRVRREDPLAYFAEREIVRERNGVAPHDEGITWNTFRSSIGADYKISLQTAEKEWFEAALRETQSLSPDVDSASRLPEEVRKAIQEEIRRQKSRPPGSRPSGSGIGGLLR